MLSLSTVTYSIIYNLISLDPALEEREEGV
jgi:hypothetical protein